MKVTARTIAHAVVELCRVLLPEEHPAAIDAALTLLRRHHLQRQMRIFPRLVQEAWHEQEGMILVTLTTPSGDAGAEREDLNRALEMLLQRKVELEQESDPSLIGGATLSFGDERIDLSLRTALSAWQTSARSAPLTPA